MQDKQFRTIGLRVCAAAALWLAAASAAAAPPGGPTWSQTLQAARRTTVRLFMYGASQATNHYIDDYVTPRLAKRYAVTLARTPVADTGDVVNTLLAEKMAGKRPGAIDLVWINGENFAAGAQAHLWLNAWAQKLPNARYIDWQDASINRDFGLPVRGREAPWSRAQFVMIYDSAKVDDPPRTAKRLLAWVKKHPGRFTYPAPPAYTGNAFVEQILFEVSGRHRLFLAPFDRGRFNQAAPELWGYLNRLAPHLWRGGRTYPVSAARLDTLYENGEVDFTMNYNPAYAQRQIDKGLFPKSTRSYVFAAGTLSNTSYMAIPANAPNKAGAKVVANFLESPAAQRAKQDPKQLGDLTVLDRHRLSPKQRRAFAIPRGPAVLPSRVLARHRRREADSSWIAPLQTGWRRHVAR